MSDRPAVGEWFAVAAVAAAVSIYLYRHWALLEAPLRQLLEGLG